MNLSARILTLMTGMTDDQVRRMPYPERLRLAREALRILQACDVAAPAKPAAGVLADLTDGRGRS
jgi:hypothetical protein